MTNLEFNRQLRQKNLKYRERFGCIPSILDYSCTREEYLRAMDAAIASGKALERFLSRYTAPADSGAEIL